MTSSAFWRGCAAFQVTARGSTFARRHLADDPVSAGRALNVAYAVAGTAVVRGQRVDLRVKIVDVAGDSVLSTRDFAAARADFSALIDELVDQIVQSADIQVAVAEARRVSSMPVEARSIGPMSPNGAVGLPRNRLAGRQSERSACGFRTFG